MDLQDRPGSASTAAHRIAMFDTSIEEFKEWRVQLRWSAPYDVTIDKNEEA